MYNKPFIKKKVDKLCKLYNLSNPEDLFAILPQEMELAEVRGIIDGVSGEEKKKAVSDVIMGIAAKNKVKISQEMIEIFIDVIASASKGKYALNKEKI